MLTGFEGRMMETSASAPKLAFGPPYLLSAGDLDGDGAADLLEISDDGDEVLVVGRRGFDGAVLWENRHRVDLGYVLPARFPGADGYYFAGYQVVDGVLWLESGQRILQLNVVAIGGGGVERWRRSFDGERINTPLRETYVFPYIGGIAEFTGDPSEDVLVGVESWIQSGEEFEASLRTVMLDGVKGAPAGETLVDSHGVEPVVDGFVDLDADGSSEFLLVEYPLAWESPDLPVVSVYRGSDSSLLWRRELALDAGSFPQAIGDFNRDGMGDLAISTWSWDADGYEGNTFVLDGPAGAVLWATSTPWGVSPLGDIDADGATELLATDVRFFGDSFHVQYEALGIDGVEYSKVYDVPPPTSDGYEFAVSWGGRLGDLDADGIPDSGHDLRMTYTDGSTALERGAVAGASGEKLWSGPLFTAVEGSLDGVGDDFLDVVFGEDAMELTARDGRDASELWRETFPFFVSYQLDAAVVDVTGDGAGELLLTGPYAHHSGYVVDGRSGESLWPATSVEPWSESKPYVAAGGELLTLGPLATAVTDQCEGDSLGQGGTCFNLRGGEREVSISLADASKQPAAAYVEFFTNLGRVGTYICGIANLSVPPGSTRLWVRTHLDGAFACPHLPFATTGTVEVRFT